MKKCVTIIKSLDHTRKGEEMFSYNNNTKEKALYITISSEIKYNFNFLDSITELMIKVENSGCEKIYFSCEIDNINFNNMGTAYLYNVLIFFSRKKKVFIHKQLEQLFHEKVSHSDGKKFKEINVDKDKLSEIQQCYCIRDDKAVNQTVQTLVEFILKNNLVFENAREFLITTIGEIFSNAFNHSNEKLVFFMYGIEWHNGKVYLVINITDYGKTIINNVQNYQKIQYERELDSKECIAWAMKEGNTTRIGSGGYGLSTLVDYVSKVKGELLIFSGDCMYALKGNNENILRSKGSFMGTSVSMKLPLFDTSKAISYDKENNKIISIALDQI